MRFIIAGLAKLYSNMFSDGYLSWIRAAYKSMLENNTKIEDRKVVENIVVVVFLICLLSEM